MSEQQLWIERSGDFEYVGKNEQGAQVAIGKGSGQFSPGELLQLALVSCQAMTADSRISKALGSDVQYFGGVTTTKPEDGSDRYQKITVELVGDFSALDDDSYRKLAENAKKNIERYCTVGNTLEHGASVELRFVNEGT